MEESSHHDGVASFETDAEYSAEPHRRHRGHAADHRRARRLRPSFFALAGFWGFASGIVATLLGLVGAEARIDWSSSAVTALAAGAIAAGAGGIVLSKAYGEMKSRR